MRRRAFKQKSAGVAFSGAAAHGRENRRFQITGNFERYTDSEWVRVVRQKHSPLWQADLIAGE